MEIEGSSSSSGPRVGSIPAGPVLVTGAGGYLGSRVIDRLKAVGVDAIGLARGHGSDIVCDLLDAGRVRKTVGRTGAAVVVHCAAAVPKTAAAYNDAEAASHSVRMVRNLLDAGVENIVFVSSMTVYAPGDGAPVKEDQTAPQSAYGLAKMEAEGLLIADPRCSAAILRLPGLFGPPRRNGLVYALCDAVLKRRQPTLPAQPMMWAAMHVDDAAEILVRGAIRRPGPDIVANVGYSGALSVSLLVRHLQEITGVEIPYDLPHPTFQMDLGTLESSLGLPQGNLAGRLSEMLEYAAADVV
jgi:nucleoside-diphosphate-sugar epimerase